MLQLKTLSSWPARILLLALCVSSAHLSAGALPWAVDGKKLPSLAPMLKQVTPAVVNISTQRMSQGLESPLLEDPLFRHFFENFLGLPDQQQLRRQQKAKPHSLGSGVIIDAKQGYVITNHHVIKGATGIEVTLQDGRNLTAQLVGSDPDTDIALLQIPAENLSALPLANSEQLEVGDFVVAIGNPFGLGQTVTSGIVSALGRSGLGIEGYEDFIQTDASINPGNSGGALVNLNGELVGINTAILAPGGGNIGIGFAIPSNIVHSITAHLRDYGRVKRGSLGIEGQTLSAELAEAFGLENTRGALVSRVLRDSSAEQAGVQAGDVITAVNNKKVTDFDSLLNHIGLLRTGDKLELRVLRQGRSLTLTAYLQENAQKMSGSAISSWLEGSELEEAQIQLRYERLKGILINQLSAYTPAWNIGFRVGDLILSVDDERISTLQELQYSLSSGGWHEVRLLRQQRLLTLRLR